MQYLAACGTNSQAEADFRFPVLITEPESADDSQEYIEDQIGGVCGILKRDDYSREERAAYFMLPTSYFKEWNEQQLAWDRSSSFKGRTLNTSK